MKNIIIVTLLGIWCLLNLSLVSNAQVTLQGKTFVENVQKRQGVKTEYTYKYKDIEYPIYITVRGRCYILVTSKKGKEYKKYLGEEISKQVCKLLNIEYK